MRILIVDDDLVCREDLKEDLGPEHEYSEAYDGDQGLEKFRSGIFDLVITDLGMVKMNGDKMAEAIRAISEVPIIMWTATLGVKCPFVNAIVQKGRLENLLDAIERACS